ncbi:hypothetical protein BDZ94DRAFT_1284298 [Collybia nuda]|uniref:Acetyl-CoA synthetase-like protein n=1 Tax=Collybia nuda TaxID=64659 RepID=A0A9P5Y1M3_9AGAR|nr:hypothetical protein BDZ94DRAFT_1284298 [Collybia nuda]
MAFPTLQGVSSSTFRPPPLDGSLTLPEVFDFHAANNPGHPLFRYEDHDGLHTIVWSSAVEAFHAAAQLVQGDVPSDAKGSSPKVISILAATDSITYFTLIAGIMRAGFQAFPISPRNSAVAIAHLLKSTSSAYLYVSSDPAMQGLARSALDMMASESKVPVMQLTMPTFSTLFGSGTRNHLPPMEKVDRDQPAIILHSSGSTAFPKPIKFTYRTLLQSGLLPYYGETDICGETLSSHAVPMFHLMGVVQLPWTAYSGLTIAVFPPTLPPTIPTPDKVFAAALATNCSLVFCVPVFLEVFSLVESWARDPARLPALQGFKTLIFAGGPLQPSVGDMLVENNVNIVPLYGLTETGTVTLFLPKQPPKEGWDYFRFSPHCSPVCVPLEDQEGVYHLVMKETPTHTPTVLNTTVDGVKALNTNDLLVRHPTNPELWKVFGRQDDQIMHSTGEKTNPVPLEAILMKDTRITNVVMFGRGKFHAGALVVPDQPFEPSDLTHLAEYRNAIWPTIEQANNFAPSHSRIFKEMIIVANPKKPFELTAKGTPRRHVVLDAYAGEIEAAYDAVEQSSQVHLQPPSTFTPEATLLFIRRALAEVMPKVPADGDDIFQHGCDSLQATWLRNTILHAIRVSALKVNTRTLPYNFVYSNPTIRKLADYVVRVSQGAQPSVEGAHERAAAMKAMVQKYTSDFPRHMPSNKAPSRNCVLMTGTTGVLGSFILKSLLETPNIDLVFGLNRPDAKNNRNIRDRQISSFENAGINGSLIDSPKLRLVEGDLNAQNFGLSLEVHEEIRVKTTTIIHNAWQVEFNRLLSSMEPLVRGTRRLIDFALIAPHPSPRQLVFISSSSVVLNWSGSSTTPEGPVTDPGVTMGSGYSDSKWVTERVLDAAAGYGFSPIVIRPGQLCGGIGGAWKTNEWFPALVRSGQILGYLPDISGVVSWFRTSTAATAVVELMDSKERYFQIAHPSPIPMSLVLQTLSTIFGIPIVPYAKWLSALEAAASGGNPGTDNPAVHLLEFFASRKKNAEAADSSIEALFGTSLATTLTAASAPSLGSATKIGPEDIESWVVYWRKIGFLA